MVTTLPDDDIKEIFYHAIPNTWRKNMSNQEYNHLDRSIQEMPGFFETRVENFETSAPPPTVKKALKEKLEAPRNRKFHIMRILTKIT